jgi:hypothetical protein
MRALQLIMELLSYRIAGGQVSNLYEMADGATESDITEAIRKETEERYAEWQAAKDAAQVVRDIVVEARGSYGTGPLTNDVAWQEAVSTFRAKYNNHRQACATGLPLTLRAFENASDRRRPSGLTAEAYRRLLLTTDPIQALADQFNMSNEEVVAIKKPASDQYLEWTFLARVINRFAKKSREGAVACVDFTLQLIDTLLDGTHAATFPKTKIKGSGSFSYEFSMFRINVDELAAMARYVRDQVQDSGHDEHVVRKVLMSFERIWHFAIPEVHREEWLDVDPREGVARLLAHS